MAKCVYKVKLANREVGEFDSDRLLDEWIAATYSGDPKSNKHLEFISKYIKNKDFIFDSSDNASKQTAALEVINRIAEDLKQRSDRKTVSTNISYTYDSETDTLVVGEDEITKYERLIGVTKLINNAGNWQDVTRAMITESNQTDYEEYLKSKIWTELNSDTFKQEWLRNHPEDTRFIKLNEYVTSRQKEIILKYRAYRKNAQLVGEDIHKLMEFHANEKMGIEAKLIPGYILTSSDQEAVKDTTKAIFDEICNKYGFSKNAVFLPEFDVFSPNLNGEVKQHLQSIEELDKPIIDGVFGRIDLLVIDNGKAYIFDFKTTAEKEVGDWQETDNKIIRDQGWWASAKKQEAMKQIAVYGAMLEAQGIEFGGGEIIPITINYELDSDGYPIDIQTKTVTVNGKSYQVATDSPTHRNIKNLHLDKSTERWNEATNSYKRSSAPLIKYKYFPLAQRIISTVKPLSINETIEDNEDLEFMFPTRANQGDTEFKVSINYYLGKDENGKQIGKSRLVPLGNSIKDTSMRSNGYTHKMYTSPKVTMPGKKAGEPIYFKSDSGQEVERLIGEYCDILNRTLKQEFNFFANQFANAMQISGNDESAIDAAITNLVGNDPRRKEYILSQFNRYLGGGWQLYGSGTENNTLIQNGIFIFYKNDIVEIVMMSHDPLHYEVNFGTKRNPLKNIVNGLSRVPEDAMSTLSSSKGNMLLMKAMLLISKDPSIYRNGEAKIRAIRAINPWQMQSSWTDNDMLLSSWTRITSLSGRRFNLVPKNAFFTPVESAISEAKDLLALTPLWIYTNSKFANIENVENTVRDILSILKRHKRDAFNDDGTPIITDNIGYAAYCLMNACLLNRDLRIPLEHDAPKFLEGGINPTGTHVVPAGSSKAVTARMLDKLTAAFYDQYATLNTERIAGINKHFKTIYDKVGYNPNLTKRTKFWAQFFEEQNGRVGKQMKIRDFNDTAFWGQYDSEVKLAWISILNTLATYKGVSKTETGSYDTSDPKYYDIPLIRGSFIESISANVSEKGIMHGIFDVCKDRIKNFKYKAENLFYGNESIYTKNSIDEDLTRALTNNYCNYEISDREKILENDAVAYSTDMEAIMGLCVLAQSISETSKTYGTLYAGIKTALAVNEKLGGEDTPELFEFVEKYIQRNYKGLGIMDDSLKGAAAALNFVKGITSKLALGFNTRAFTREMLVSLYVGLMRSGNNLIEGISAEDFAYGLGYVFSHAPANINKHDMVGQLNQRFRMAGQSREEIAENNFISDFALRTVNMDELTFIGTTIPDNFFRVAMLIAKMHADNCFEAYSLEGNEKQLIYDPHKDKRFNKYITDGDNPIFKPYDPTMGAKSAYLQAESLWNKYIDEWKLQYPNKTITHPLEAYPPSEIASIQSRANKLYGNFDSHTKSLMCYQFIGSAIMQYKTWLSAKIEQWLKSGGFVNIWRQVHKIDENGNKLYILANTAEDIDSGKSVIEFITEDQITQDMINSGRVTPYIVTEGTYTEGMLQSTIGFAQSLLKLDFDSFKEQWDDPIKRGNLICGIIDMFGLMLFAGLVRLIFGEDVVNNKRDQSWIVQWSYGVLIGFADDGPIHKVLGSMAGDWNPPSLLTLQRLAETTTSVINGNKTVPQGILESFGATSELSGYFRQ